MKNESHSEQSSNYGTVIVTQKKINNDNLLHVVCNCSSPSIKQLKSIGYPCLCETIRTLQDMYYDETKYLKKGEVMINENLYKEFISKLSYIEKARRYGGID